MLVDTQQSNLKNVLFIFKAIRHSITENWAFLLILDFLIAVNFQIVFINVLNFAIHLFGQASSSPEIPTKLIYCPKFWISRWKISNNEFRSIGFYFFATWDFKNIMDSMLRQNSIHYEKIDIMLRLIIGIGHKNQ